MARSVYVARYALSCVMLALLLTNGCVTGKSTSPESNAKEMLHLLRTINEEPDVPHSEYSAASWRLIKLGPKSVPYLATAYQIGSSETRGRAIVALMQIVRNVSDSNGDGELSDSEETSQNDTLSYLGAPDDADEAPERRAIAKRWCDWAESWVNAHQ
jgi:hypothetical protein